MGVSPCLIEHQVTCVEAIKYFRYGGKEGFCRRFRSIVGRGAVVDRPARGVQSVNDVLCSVTPVLVEVKDANKLCSSRFF